MRIVICERQFMALAAKNRNDGASHALDQNAINIILGALDEADKNNHAEYVRSPYDRAKKYMDKRTEYESNEGRTGKLPKYGSICKYYRKKPDGDSDVLEKKVGKEFKEVLPVEQYLELAQGLSADHETLLDIREELEKDYAIGRKTFMLLGRTTAALVDIQAGLSSNQRNSSDEGDVDIEGEVYIDPASSNLAMIPSGNNNTAMVTSSGNDLVERMVNQAAASGGNITLVAHVEHGNFGGNQVNLQDVYNAAERGATMGADSAVERSMKKSSIPASVRKARLIPEDDSVITRLHDCRVDSPFVEDVTSSDDEVEIAHAESPDAAKKPAAKKLTRPKATKPNDENGKSIRFANAQKTGEKKPAAKTTSKPKATKLTDDNGNPIRCEAIKKSDGKPCPSTAKFYVDGVAYCGRHKKPAN